MTAPRQNPIGARMRAVNAIILRPVFTVGVVALILAPTLRAAPDDAFGLPLIQGGDQPHYLLALNSVLRDGDLDLAIDFESVYRGEDRAGKRFVGVPLMHHTVWLEESGPRVWGHVYAFERPTAEWHDQGGRFLPPLREGFAPRLPPKSEYSDHPYGHAFLLSPILFPLRGTDYLEPAAIAVTSLVGVLGFFALVALGGCFSENPAAVRVVAASLVLGTPWWHYSRTLYNEPFLCMFAIAAYAFVFRRRSFAFAGALIGIGLLMKPPFALLAAPLWLYVVWRERHWKPALLFALPVMAGVGVVLGLNAMVLGSPWQSMTPFYSGSVVEGGLGLLFSKSHGLVLYSPIMILAMLGWSGMWRRHRKESIAILASVAAYFLLMATWLGWHGGPTYGPRLIMPIVPLFGIGLLGLDFDSRRGPLAIFAAAALVLSLVTSGLASFWYWKYPELHPLLEVLGLS